MCWGIKVGEQINGGGFWAVKKKRRAKKMGEEIERSVPNKIIKFLCFVR